MNCKLCNGTDLKLLNFEIPKDAGEWFRCQMCGSDNSSLEFDPSVYGKKYIDEHIENIGGLDAGKETVRSNCDWFGHYLDGLPNRDFLDVGCCDGSVLRVMAEMGWSVHGFDIAKPPYYGPHVTVAPLFHRWLFPQRYSAVLAREVFEHVPFPDLFLHELHGVTVPRGLIQIQTPKPIEQYHPNIYQKSHMFIASTGRMRHMINLAMMDILDFREWGDSTTQAGQAYLCRARG